MRILVTGAAGYIGSAVCWKLLDYGHEVIALDNLKYGVRGAVPRACDLIVEDLESLTALPNVDVVVHLAAESLIPLSFEDPLLFGHVNVTGGLRLLELMKQKGCSRFVYSSTSSVYDPFANMPLREYSPVNPSSPYGASKLAFELLLKWMSWLNAITFRYFNVCGATENVWERPYHRSRIIPVALDVAKGRTSSMPLNGTNYNTTDGTCVRDYVHVDDIAEAHAAAVEKIDKVQGVFNLGIGKCYSNREVIRTVERVTGKPIPVTESPRRSGDPPTLVSDPEKAMGTLGWCPKYKTLESMIESAWRWEP